MSDIQCSGRAQPFPGAGALVGRRPWFQTLSVGLWGSREVLNTTGELRPRLLDTRMRLPPDARWLVVRRHDAQIPGHRRKAGLRGPLGDAVGDLEALHGFDEAVHGFDALASASGSESHGSLRGHIGRIGVDRQLHGAVSPGIQAFRPPLAPGKPSSPAP